MIIEGVRIGKQATDVLGTSLRSSVGLGRPVVDHMVDRTEGTHDPVIALVLSLVSAYSYADIDTFARGVARLDLGPEAEVVGIGSTNPELLVDTTAYLVQSADKRLAILSFRGTVLKNLTNWLMDTSARQEFILPRTIRRKGWDLGSVHGGLVRTANVSLPTIFSVLASAMKGYPICASAIREKFRVRDCMTDAWWRGATSGPAAEAAEGPDIVGRLPPLPPSDAPNKLEALYITGHSMGGALAVITAAYTGMVGDLTDLFRVLRGVYTYGQPVVGDERFAKVMSRGLGYKLHRHVHGVDVIPRVPPRTMGRFVHFGNELASSDDGWVCRSEAVRQVLSGLYAIGLSFSAWVQRQLVGIPQLQRLPLPYSIADHDPFNYVQTSGSRFPELHVHGLL